MQGQRLCGNRDCSRTNYCQRCCKVLAVFEGADFGEALQTGTFIIILSKALSVGAVPRVRSTGKNE